ncbi:hypothetical protein NHH03_00195, partial [Stieleria sp. TO1_6]|uniref:hypothetical protein n=1 Tax=Stieleria tagensis TaxID=2956795 RepID=UPI00209AA86E
RWHGVRQPNIMTQLDFEEDGNQTMFRNRESGFCLSFKSIVAISEIANVPVTTRVEVVDLAARVLRCKREFEAIDFRTPNFQQRPLLLGVFHTLLMVDETPIAVAQQNEPHESIVSVWPG